MLRRRSRTWCFTLQVAQNAIILTQPPEGPSYCVYQYEEAPTTGQRHIQGYMVFDNARTGASISKLLENWGGAKPHLEVARGSSEQNLDYCTKPETRVNGTQPFIFGEPPAGQGTRSDLADAFAELQSHGFSEDLVQRYPSQFIMYGAQMDRVAERIRFIHWKPRDAFKPPRVHIMWGKTGTGKTRTAAEYGAVMCDYDSRYPWGHYRGEDVVCLDEFTGQIPLSTLLKWTDGYQITVQIPYLGNRPFIPTMVFICSNLNPIDWYPHANPEQREALRRRCTTIAFYDRIAPWGTIRRYSKGVTEPEALLWASELPDQHPESVHVTRGVNEPDQPVLPQAQGPVVTADNYPGL